MTKYANVTAHQAKLADDFARDWVVRLFGDEVLKAIDEALPTYQRGSRTGRPKGVLKWWKAHSPGFAKEVQTGVRPGTIRVELWTGIGDKSIDLCFAFAVLGKPHRHDDGSTYDRPRLEAAGRALKGK